MATNAVAGGSKAARSRRIASPQCTVTLSWPASVRVERLLEPPVDLDRVHVRAAPGEARRERADARADLERDVVGRERRQPLDHAEQVVVDEEVLPELAIGPQAELGQPGERDLARRAHGRAKTRAAFASTCAASSPASTPRIAATARSVSST